MATEYTLLVRDGDRRREVLLVGTVTVGRSPSCEISSADPRLSRTHAAFEQVGMDVVVRDLGSSNGTRVNGVAITEHRLRAGDVVDVGPFSVQLRLAAPAAPEGPSPLFEEDEPATVLRPFRAPPAAPPPVAPAPVAPSPTAPAFVAPPDDDGDDEPTRHLPPPRRPLAAPPRVEAAAPRVEPPRVEPPTPAPAAAPADHLAAPGARATAARELPFARVALLWIVPVALVAFLAGLVPDLLAPDQRGPLLRAHYTELAAGAVDLVHAAREPDMPLDSVTSRLRQHAGVTAARIVGTDGRVLAPLGEAGTAVTAPAGGQTMRVVDGAGGTVELLVPAVTSAGRDVAIVMAVDPARIQAAPPSSPAATVLLLACLAAAWLIASRLSRIVDVRLLRLGEEIELMTTGQVRSGEDPFGLRGARRILDAVTFALSPAGRMAGQPVSAPPSAGVAGAPRARAAVTAGLEADGGFRIVRIDAGCGGVVDLVPGAGAGMHLIDVLLEQAVANEVLRLLTSAGEGQAARGEVADARAGRLAVEVNRGPGGAPLRIRFTRL